MQKALTVLALALVCIAATSATYYYGKYLPRIHDAELVEHRRKTDLENSQRCNKDALTFYSDFRSNYRKSEISLGAPPTPEWVWNDPEMHFNRKLNTCLVEVSYRNDAVGDGVEITKFVTDVYSNRQIILVAYGLLHGEEQTTANEGGIHGSKEYSAEKDRLFRE